MSENTTFRAIALHAQITATLVAEFLRDTVVHEDKSEFDQAVKVAGEVATTIIAQSVQLMSEE